MRISQIWTLFAELVRTSHYAGKTGEYIHKSPFSAKNVRILVRGHYLLRDVISFPRAKLQENRPLQIGYFYTTSWN